MNATGIQSRAGETAMRFTPLKGERIEKKKDASQRPFFYKVLVCLLF